VIFRRLKQKVSNKTTTRLNLWRYFLLHLINVRILSGHSINWNFRRGTGGGFGVSDAVYGGDFTGIITQYFRVSSGLVNFIT